MSLLRYAQYRACGIPWVGEIPKHWTIVPLKAIASGRDDAFIDGDWIESRHLADAGVRYITTGNVGTGFYKDQGTGYISDHTFTELGCTEVLPGDVLISRLNAPIGRACLVPDLGVRVVTSVDNVIVRPSPQFDRRFLVFRLSSPDYLYEAGTIASGATMQRISRRELGNIRIAFPPLEEQTAIAAFLDRETTKIDALIAEQEKLIALLAEKRQAAISHAVTRGLNPNVPMKDSGVAWLGEVPAHWGVVRLGAILREVNEPGNEELPVLSVSIHDGVSDKELDENEMERKVTRSDDRSKYKAVSPGDLTYNMMRAWQGGFGSVVVPGMVSPAYVVTRPTKDFLTSHVEMILRSPLAVAEMKRHSRGITDFRLRLYWEEFKAIQIPFPPKSEQLEIAVFIKTEATKIDVLRAEADRTITLLKERRSALIAAAVTGQIDVRNA